MSIRFKFRSSLNFDSVDIDGKPSISVRDLRYKIVLQKHLNFCQEFDLVFSDALTGQEYNDEKFLIPSGSSVIIKRVPAGTVPSAQLRDQKLEASDLSEAIPKGSNHSGGEEIIPQKPESEFEEHMKLEKVDGANFIDLQSAGLPSELKCSLCNTFFKEAVMIPCCQHSFCQKCISQVLITKARCPKCSSSKCRAEDLLPNLSLRHAIEHFLESQLLTTGPDNALREYAPDGESGIHAKEVSCAVTVIKRNLDLLNSSSATEKGSNRNIAESFYESRNRKNEYLEGSGYHIGNFNAVGTLKSAPSLLRVKHIDGERNGPEDLAVAADSQGENQPLNLPQAHVPDEADSTIRKRRLWVDPGGGGQSFVVAGRNKKADRTCYMCGSPDHFIRDCPVASTPHPKYQTGDSMVQGGMPGYAMPYWSGAAFHPNRPYMNMYGNPGMVPFNANMVPVSPYAVPQYIRSVYGGLPVPSGIMRTGGLAPPVGTRGPINHSEFLDFWDGDNRRKLPNERGHPFDHEDDESHKHHRYHELERSGEYKSHTEREKSVTNSEGSHGRKLRRKHHRHKHIDHNIQSVDERSRSTIAGKDRRSCHSEQSNSEVEDMPNSTDRYSEARHKQHYRSSKKHHENRGQSGSDSSWSRHQSKKERYVKRRVESDVRDFQHKHKSRSSSGLEPSSSGDQKKRSKDIEYTCGLTESRNRTKPIADELCSDRWQMVNGSDEDCIEGYLHRKRKRGL